MLCSSSKGGDHVEPWSEVAMGVVLTREDGLGERVLRKNVEGRVKDTGGGRITNLVFGGNKMILTRKEQQCVEVRQSSRSV